MSKILLSLAICLVGLNKIAAQQIQKGFGSSNSTFLFGYTSYAAKSQSMYWPSDLSNLMSGDITRIYFKYGSHSADQILTRFSIEMGQTSQTAYTNNEFFTGLTPVYYRNSQTIPQDISGNWFHFDLDTPFTYDSTLTLIVQLIFPESAVDNWGTLGTSNNPVKKIISADTLATMGSGTSGTWQDFGFDLATPTGVISYFSKNDAFDFSIAPNPVKEILQINLISTSNTFNELNITNALGEVVLTKTMINKSEIIDLTQLNAGIFFVNIKNQEGKIKSKKFILAK